MRARTTGLGLVLCLSGLPELAPAAESGAPSEALTCADQAGERGEWHRAVACLRSAVATAEPDYALWLAYAHALLEAGEWSEAAAAYRRAAQVSEGGFAPRQGLAAALLGAKRYAEARELLVTLVAERPEDPALRDQLALAWFWLGHLDEAEKSYRAAQDVAPADVPAALGLAWIAQRRGEIAEARWRFSAVLADHPDEATAAEGLAALGSRWKTSASLTLSAESLDQGFKVASPSDALTLLPGYAITAGIDQTLADRWLLRLRYRHLGSIELGDTIISSSSTSLGFGQDEGHLEVGYGSPAWGAALYGAGVAFHTSSSVTSSGHSGGMFGAGGHYRLWADLLGSATYSIYDDLAVFQGELGATLPLLPSLALFAGARLQTSSGVVDPSAEAELRLRGLGGEAILGGSYGNQLRPVDLATAVIYNSAYTLLWRGSGRLTMPLTEALSASLAYEYEWYVLSAATSTASAVEAGNHRVTAGLTLAL